MNDYTAQAKRYLILIEGGPPSNYSAWSPDLPGCAATGDTLEEVEREMRAVIAFTSRGSMKTASRSRSPLAPASMSSARLPRRKESSGLLERTLTITSRL